MNKTILLFTLLSLIATKGFTQTEFITTWNTDSEDDPGSTTITIPTNSAYAYSYNVDWDNNGTFDEFGITGDITHDFGSTGTYTIRIQGTFPAIYFNAGGDCEKLLSIDQWGTIAWSDMNYAFAGCENLTYNAADTPDLSAVTDLSEMFKGCSVFNGDISNWNVDNVTTMENMFKYAYEFDQDLSNWDVSNVTIMDGVFHSATNFNGDISNWNVSNVTSMSSMFRNADSFNIDISDWNVNNVESMSYMFYYAKSFNQNIGNWKTDSVTSLFRTFTTALEFDQDLSNWNVSNVTTMREMFFVSGLSTQNYDKLLQGWSAQNVQDGVDFGAMGVGYCNAGSYRDTLISKHGWSITDNGQTCDDTHYFITTWKTDIEGTSNDSTILIPTNDDYSYSYDIDWDNDGVFDTLAITGEYEHTFSAPGTYTIQIRGIFPVINMNFEGDREKLLSVDQWGTIHWKTFSSAFAGCTNMDILATDTPDLSEVNSLSAAFYECTSLTQGLSDWDVSNVDNMSYTFQSSSFNGDIISWNVSSVETMFAMFKNSSFNQNIGNWNVSAASTFQYMFSGTSFNQDISSWDVSSSTMLDHMFEGNSQFNVDISSWNVSNVKLFQNMFNNAESFNQDLSSWNIENAEVLSDVFSYSGLSTENYDLILEAWSQQDVNYGCSFGAEGISYCKSGDYRESLTANQFWNISDAGQEMEAPVPNLQNLPDVIGQCEVTQLIAPKATDNCSDMVYVSHNATLPITEQGTTLVTWTFEDSNGNTSTQTQNVIIEDVMAPAISCVEDKEIKIIGNSYTVQGSEFDPVSTFDNCEITTIVNDVNNSETLEGVELPVGTNTISWTITDNSGNTNTCTFNVVVSTSTSLESHPFGNIKLYPNPAKDYVFIKGLTGYARVLLNIYSANGNMIYSTNTSGNLKVDVSEFESGIYFIQINHPNLVETLKLIIQ